jgi:hypothetical protein
VNEPGDISVARVIDLCRERDVRLAYEIGAFVVFEACEAVLAQPRAVRAGDVWVSPEGATRVAQSPPGRWRRGGSRPGRAAGGRVGRGRPRGARHADAPGGRATGPQAGSRGLPRRTRGGARALEPRGGPARAGSPAARADTSEGWRPARRRRGLGARGCCRRRRGPRRSAGLRGAPRAGRAGGSRSAFGAPSTCATGRHARAHEGTHGQRCAGRSWAGAGTARLATRTGSRRGHRGARPGASRVRSFLVLVIVLAIGAGVYLWLASQA